MHMMGYEPVYKPKRRPIRAIDFAAPISSILDSMMEEVTVEYEVEWVRRRPMFYDVPRSAYKEPAPKQHRRNV